jgi:hypothetical protein
VPLSFKFLQDHLFTCPLGALKILIEEEQKLCKKSSISTARVCEM